MGTEHEEEELLMENLADEHPEGPWRRNKLVKFTMALKDVTFKTTRQSTFGRTPLAAPAGGLTSTADLIAATASNSESDSLTVVSGEITGALETIQDGENDWDFQDPDVDEDPEAKEAWKQQVIEGLQQLLALAKQFTAVRAPGPFEGR